MSEENYRVWRVRDPGAFSPYFDCQYLQRYRRGAWQPLEFNNAEEAAELYAEEFIMDNIGDAENPNCARFEDGVDLEVISPDGTVTICHTKILSISCSATKKGEEQ